MADKKVLIDIEVTDIGIVEAPKCEACSTSMLGFDALTWYCPNEECSEVGKAVSGNGVYPFAKVLEGMKPKGEADGC